MVSNIKIGIAAGALAVAAFSVTQPEEKLTDITQEVRIPESIDRGSPPSLQMYKYIKMYADTFNIPLRYAFGIANAETSYKGPFHWNYNSRTDASDG